MDKYQLTKEMIEEIEDDFKTFKFYYNPNGLYPFNRKIEFKDFIAAYFHLKNTWETKFPTEKFVFETFEREVASC